MDVSPAKRSYFTCANVWWKLLFHSTPGKYVLKETKAPEGYSLSANVWQVLVRDNQSVEVTLNGVPVEKSDDGAFVIENIKLYSLPSTGGSGIYWYMIGGMVLMSAAAWILYKNKCREVLGK